ncbi:hypothetical protein KAR91_20870 [Candidatus Pacearchaeota archaeon]|nr:hypothetical protein [Candidatus Pacearchaeota archaeon]
MTCKVCGGTMVGDGYVTLLRCENIELDMDMLSLEPDAGPIFCIINEESNYN